MDKIKRYSDYKIDSDYIYDHSGVRVKKFSKKEIKRIVFGYSILKKTKEKIFFSFFILSVLWLYIYSKIIVYVDISNFEYEQISSSPQEIHTLILIFIISSFSPSSFFMKKRHVIMALEDDKFILEFGLFFSKKKFFKFYNDFLNNGWEVKVEPNNLINRSENTSA